MRNNNTFGIKNPTGSIGRYSTEELNEMASAKGMNNPHERDDIMPKAKDHEAKNTKP